MSYSFARTVDLPFDQAVARITETLGERGFGVLTTIDVKATLKKKIGADVAPYTILGACNPNYAHEAMKMEPRIGVMLPCNVIVRQVDGGVEVAAVDPKASMAAVDNPNLSEVADTVGAMLKEAVDAV